jgi:hypothetical protein
MLQMSNRRKEKLPLGRFSDGSTQYARPPEGYDDGALEW